MTARRTQALACAVFVFGTFRLAAGLPQEREYMTFDTAVELPGTVLPAGTYVFERATRGSHPEHLVIVRSPDRSLTHFVGITNPIARPWNLQGGSVVVFGDSRRGMPRPIRAWYPEGGFAGHKFIY